METAGSLRKELKDIQQELRSGKISVNEAKEHANIAGKMINSAKIQVEYYALLGETPKIDFLKDDS
ncbi:MAG TPA: hypothetical protein DEP37_13200 [Algoriphagus sp.]|nr:hypothetical protein [Algoriphagus sp.]|tara:strand:- start:527 stop:724 length:198 start_codon:yes stop_codon:yes gene_type:complete